MRAAGRLRDQAVIERRGTAVDAVGQPVETWFEVATVWADIRHPSGLEATRSDATTSIVRASIRIDELSGIDAGMRVTRGGTVYEIKAVLPVYPAAMDLVCEKVGQ
jgi:SPP1 family predicted phage head-tail adaptor